MNRHPTSLRVAIECIDKQFQLQINDLVNLRELMDRLAQGPDDTHGVFSALSDCLSNKIDNLDGTLQSLREALESPSLKAA